MRCAGATLGAPPACTLSSEHFANPVTTPFSETRPPTPPAPCSTYEEYSKAGLTWHQELEGEVEAALRGVTYMPREKIAE